MPSFRFLSFLFGAVVLLGYLLCGCNGGILGGSEVYRIGRDQSWYPLNLMGKDKYLTAFSDDLLAAIGEEEGVRFLMGGSDSFNLQEELESDIYDGVLSSLQPTRITFLPLN